MKGPLVTATSVAKERWTRFWVRRSGLGRAGRVAARLAIWFAAPYKGMAALAYKDPRGFIAPGACVHHKDLRLGANVFIGDGVTIYQHSGGGPVVLGDRVAIHSRTIIEVGRGGALLVAADTHIQPGCQFSAYEQAIRIGSRVQIAPACAFYPYDHGTRPGVPMREQPLTSRGAIIVEDDVWLGYGVVLLSGVRVGAGAVLGAGAVVARDIPAGAIAVGVPAQVIRMRDQDETIDAAACSRGDAGL